MTLEELKGHKEGALREMALFKVGSTLCGGSVPSKGRQGRRERWGADLAWGPHPPSKASFGGAPASGYAHAPEEHLPARCALQYGRLSVQPVRPEEWTFVLGLEGQQQGGGEGAA